MHAATVADSIYELEERHKKYSRRGVISLFPVEHGRPVGTRQTPCRATRGEDKLTFVRRELDQTYCT